MIAPVHVEPGWAVGTVSLSDPAIDRDILLGASGQPWIPGSALAGSLRAHLAAADSPADVTLMGSRPPGSKAEADESTVSPLWIVGAVFRPETESGSAVGQTTLEVAGQTAIDRVRGAAAARSLRLSRLAADGGRLTVYLRHDPQPRQLSADDLQLIGNWRPAIGRDRTKGAGRATLTELRHGTVDPATPEGAAIWLLHDGPGLFEAVATQAITCITEDLPWLEAQFEIEDGLLVGDTQTGTVANSRERHGRPLVPGSAWKGIIRSRAEFIIRSRYRKDAVCLQQTGCGSCVACGIFGHQGQRGLLAFRDSYITQDPAQETPRTHVGIDRVTGGSRDSLLFQTAPVLSGRLCLRIDHLGAVEPWVRNLIWHVLRDIDDGLVGVGSRTTRGLGTLRLTDPPGDLQPVIVPSLDSLPEPEPAT